NHRRPHWPPRRRTRCRRHGSAHAAPRARSLLSRSDGSRQSSPDRKGLFRRAKYRSALDNYLRHDNRSQTGFRDIRSVRFLAEARTARAAQHDSAMRRVLVVTYHFPPSLAMGAQTCTQIARYLPLYGWTPTVLTVPEAYGENVGPSCQRSFHGDV